MHLQARRVGSAVFGLVLLMVAGAVAGSEDKKRRDPPRPPVIVVGAVRYEVPLLGQPFGYRQDGGIVVARDATTGELQWTRRVYRAGRDPAMEGDKQDVFIERLELAADRRRLLIVDEHGKRYQLGLDGGRLRTLP